ncbi:MAG: glycoside hydrolase family 88 protein [Bacteroidaceae bacterium]|nr:glycoside hydrolase family 88 protein [Bacteroidaceae bacterium]
MIRYLISLMICCLLAPPSFASGGWDQTLYETIEQSINAPQLKPAEYLITRYGAKPANSAAKNQKAIQKAIDICSEKGGGKVIVPAGQRFLTGAVTLKSHVNLVVEEGATLEFAFQPELYPIVATSWEGLQCYNLQPCIYAFEASDIAITGLGTIDGGGTNETWWAWCGTAKFGWKEGIPSQKLGGRARLLKSGEDGIPMTDSEGRRSAERVFTRQDGMRPQLINFNRCRRVLMEGVTLLRSPFWVIHPLESEDITVRKVRIINSGPNGDGCDPEACNRVLIEDCFFSTGDDCIAIKSGRNRDGRERGIPSQNIIIRRCEMRNGHGGVVIGSEISGGCRNVFAHDCVMDSPNLDRVLRIKTNSCRGGVIENINVRDIRVGQCREAVVKINLNYEPREICCRGFLPTVRNVNVANVSCQRSRYGLMVVGLDEDTCVSDINVSDCRFDNVADGNLIKGKTRDIILNKLFINGSLVLQQLPYGGRYSEWLTRSEMQRTRHSYLLDFSQRPKWSYVMGIELEAMLDTYLRYGGDDILAYCKEYTDTMISPQGNIRDYNLQEYNLDNIRTGHFVARMYERFPEEKNLKAMKTLMQQLERQPRTKGDKIYWHKAIYAYQVWLDGIFMGLPFRVLTARLLLKPRQAKAIFDDAVNQITATYRRTYDPQTGLNRHAYDENRNMFWADTQTGLSKHCWGRAQGWFTMALVELLDALPEDYPRRGEVISLLQKDLDAVIRWQDKQTGLWFQVMDSPEATGNYLESSCSSMFAYSLLKAANRGWLGDHYREAGTKAYEGIIRRFIRINADQTISLTGACKVAGLGPGISQQVAAALKKINPKAKAREDRRRDGSYAYYLSEPVRDNDAKAVGPFIWASLEKEKTDSLTASRISDER